jgi:hypothetical protein
MADTPKRRGKAAKATFYTRRLNQQDLADLEAALANGLQEEIAMLRLVMRRVFEHASDAELDLSAWSETLDTLGAAATRLGRLLRTQRDLGGESQGLSQALAQALGEVMREMGL